MSARRRIIAALEAKAASTTFPAEAEALRVKAAELRAKEPEAAPRRPASSGIGAVDDFVRRHQTIYNDVRTVDEAAWARIRTGDFFNAAGGVYVTGDYAPQQRIQV